VRILGHRGNPAAAPENTVAGVRSALEVGAAGVEIDVRRTRDGVLVLAHDPSLARLGGPEAPVCELDWADLRAASLAEGGAAARLDDVLDLLAGRGRAVCEVKNIPGEPDFDAPREATADALVALLNERRAAGRADDVVVSSFDWFAIERVRDAGGVPTAFLTPPGLTANACLAYVVENGHSQCHPHAEMVLAEPGMVERAADAGVEVVCWTVDDVEVARRLASYGVSAVITNDPERLLAAVG
jgi:glycerophosphoryl diester phosphodiesterase